MIITLINRAWEIERINKFKLSCNQYHYFYHSNGYWVKSVIHVGYLRVTTLKK